MCVIFLELIIVCEGISRKSYMIILSFLRTKFTENETKFQKRPATKKVTQAPIRLFIPITIGRSGKSLYRTVPSSAFAEVFSHKYAKILKVRVSI